VQISGKKWERMGTRGSADLSAPVLFRAGAIEDMFRGANNVTLDAKGRLAMPTRYRERTVDRSDRCLLIYPLPEWEEIELKLRRLPTLNPVARRLQRLMIGHATDIDLDASGRILIPPSLREFAGLSRNAVLIGQGNRFELWDEAQWNDNREQWLKVDETAEELPPELESLSL
jgi:transcriptional regulator MraZ